MTRTSEEVQRVFDENKRRVLSALDFRTYFKAAVPDLKPAGPDQMLGTCPFHPDTHSSFSLNISPDRQGLWNCKGCGKDGDIFTFHAHKHGLKGFKEALYDLAEKHGVQLEEPPHRQAQGSAKGKGKKPSSIFELPSMEDIENFHQALLNNPAGLDKLQSDRRLTEETIRRFKLGYVARRHRLSIPVFDAAGALIGVRLYSSVQKFKMVSWAKGQGRTMLYGADLLKQTYDPLKPVLICEGEFDRLLLCQEGFQAVTSTNGALAFQRDWKELFQGLDVVLVYDADDGGRKGADKTAAVLAGAVKSLRKVDLKEAGLVEGTPDSKDITDLARSNPSWPQELRKAIDAVTPLDLTETASHECTEEFVKIFEEEGKYWRWKPTREKGPVKESISNFSMKPVRRIRMDTQEVLEAEVGMNGNGPGSMVTLWPAHWATKGAFRKVLGDLGAGWSGSENEMQYLKVLLSYLPCPRYRGEPKLGLHKREGQWMLVTSDRTITKDGEIEDLIYWSDQGGRMKYETEKVEPASQDETRKMIEAMFSFNSPDVVAPILSWMFAAVFKARLIDAVPSLRRQFPLLLMWGERGAGKTKTAELVIHPFFGDYEGPSKVDEMTRFTFMVAAHSTNLIPISFDEYKPSKLQPRQMQEVSSFCRSAYNAFTGQRGFTSPDGMGARIYTYTAPVILMGEQTLTETALRERIIEVIFTKEKRKGKPHIQQFMTMNLAGLGFNFIRWSLSITDKEIAAVWNEQFEACDPVFEDRIRQNIATMRMGLVLWNRFLSEQGINVHDQVDQLLHALDACQRDALLGEGTRPKGDIDLILEGMSAMAAMDKNLLKDGEDWMIKDGSFHLRVQTAYPKFKKWAREFGFDGEVLDEQSFKRRLRDEPYFYQRGAVRGFSSNDYSAAGRQVKVYSLDLGDMIDAGLDLSGFGVEVEDFPASAAQTDLQGKDFTDEVPF